MFEGLDEIRWDRLESFGDSTAIPRSIRAAAGGTSADWFAFERLVYEPFDETLTEATAVTLPFVVELAQSPSANAPNALVYMGQLARSTAPEQYQQPFTPWDPPTEQPLEPDDRWRRLANAAFERLDSSLPMLVPSIRSQRAEVCSAAAFMFMAPALADAAKLKETASESLRMTRDGDALGALALLVGQHRWSTLPDLAEHFDHPSAFARMAAGAASMRLGDHSPATMAVFADALDESFDDVESHPVCADTGVVPWATRYLETPGILAEVLARLTSAKNLDLRGQTYDWMSAARGADARRLLPVLERAVSDEPDRSLRASARDALGCLRAELDER